MAYQEPKKRTIRLDDDVYEALKKLPESPNKFLRRVLSAGGVFAVERDEPTSRAVDRPRETWRGPLLRPKDMK